MSQKSNIGIVGGGAWGTALAQAMASVSTPGGEQNDVVIWARETEVCESINSAHENRLYLKNLPLSPTISATSQLKDIADCDTLLLVTPAQHLRATLKALPKTDAALILCAKGIEADTQMLMSEVTQEICPDNPMAVLSGPTFAHEVAAGLPTAVTLACQDQQLWERLSKQIARPHFRPYFSDDIVGAEIGGAVKNVLAIGCGVVEGYGLGQNARSALISRGFAEMVRFGKARGARTETLSGLSGLGDLVLTCSSQSSRNFTLGYGLGKGQSANELLADRHTVAEGASTAPVLHAAATKLGIEMPIVEAVHALLSGKQTASETIGMLLGRPLKAEH